MWQRKGTGNKNEEWYPLHPYLKYEKKKVSIKSSKSSVHLWHAPQTSPSFWRAYFRVENHLNCSTATRPSLTLYFIPSCPNCPKHRPHTGTSPPGCPSPITTDLGVYFCSKLEAETSRQLLRYSHGHQLFLVCPLSLPPGLLATELCWLGRQPFQVSFDSSVYGGAANHSPGRGAHAWPALAGPRSSSPWLQTWVQEGGP